MRNIINYLEMNQLFTGLSRTELADIADQFSEVVFQKNQIIFKEGDQGDKMFIIVDGETSVKKIIGLGERELRKLGNGDCFGEIALISNEKRSATIRAISKTLCATINKKDFNNFLTHNDLLNNNVIRLLNERIVSSEKIANTEILFTYQALIFSLSNLAESRDPETGAHIERVSAYCKLLAEKLSDHPSFKDLISPLFIENIYIVAPLHDIGKVGIPDSILLKPGKLTDEEFKSMKSHSAIGAQAIKKVLESCHHTTFHMAYNIVHYHHERYDGKGYPTQIAGEKIPLEARIMALADVYDALLSKRPYKPGFSYEKTINIIKEGIGTQFDPIMTQVMMDNIADFEKIHKTNSEE